MTTTSCSTAQHHHQAVNGKHWEWYTVEGSGPLLTQEIPPNRPTQTPAAEVLASRGLCVQTQPPAAAAALATGPPAPAEAGGIGGFFLLCIGAAGVVCWLRQKRESDARAVAALLSPMREVTEPSPWDLVETQPLRQRPPAPIPAPPLAMPETLGAAIGAEGAGERCAPGAGEGAAEGAGDLFSPNQEQMLSLLIADSPYNVHDDDTQVRAVIRLGQQLGLTKGQLQERFYYFKRTGERIEPSPLTKGSNSPYQRFSRIYSEVMHDAK